MAFAMQSAVQDLSVKMGEQVQLRIGIHSGPAIAGVIGTSKVFYDVWGDTVNTASRMESHGEPGRIQVTAATKAVLGDTFTFAPRGPVEINGIGVIKTFWLVGRA
jgi:adenylate cyclase